MKLLDKLIFRELLGPVINSALMFTVLLFSSTALFKLTDMLAKGVPFDIIAQLSFYGMPMLITQALPMAMLLGCLLAFGRLSGDSEHMALYASGISFYRVVRPVAILGFIVSVLSFSINELLVPPAQRKYWSVLQKALQFIDSTDKSIYYVVKQPGEDRIDEIVVIDGGYDPHQKLVRRVTIFKMSRDPKRQGQPDFAVYADHAIATSQNGIGWEYYDGRFMDLRPESVDRNIGMHFDKIKLEPEKIDMGRNFDGIMQSSPPDAFRMDTFVELRNKISKERSEGSLNTLEDEFNLWGKITFPLASMIFGIVGAPLGMRPNRGNRTMGFGIAIGIIFAYWVVYSWMFQVGKNGILAPMVASFTPDIIGMIAAVYLVARTRQ